LERARLDWGRAGGEAWAVTFGEGGPVLGGATVVGGLPGWGDDEAAIVVALAGAADAAPAAPRRRVHLVVDGSDSMRAAWPELVAAVAGLVRALDPADVLQVVAYGSRAREVVAAVPVGDGRAALAALGAVEPSGHTNLEAGLRLAYDAIRARRRTGRGAGEDAVVILLSDGVPNVGAFGPAAVGRVVAEAREELGCVTAAVGMGQGFDGAVLRAVAVEGRGGFHVASSVAALVPALTGEGATAGVAARQVDVRIEPAAGVELLGPVGEGTGLVVEGGRAVWRLPVLRAGEERRVVVRARVPAWLRAASPGALTVSFAAAGGAAAHEVALRPAVGVEAAGAGSVAALDDVALAAALARAAAALRVADAESGAAALREWAAGGRATGRRAAAADVAAALAALGAAAPDADRALVAHAMTGLALRVGR
jgi:Ca-activated chloride channel family protein